MCGRIEEQVPFRGLWNQSHTHTQAFHRVTFTYKTKREGKNNIQSIKTKDEKLLRLKTFFALFCRKKFFFVDKAKIEFSFEEIVTLNDKFYLCSYV